MLFTYGFRMHVDVRVLESRITAALQLTAWYLLFLSLRSLLCWFLDNILVKTTSIFISGAGYLSRNYLIAGGRVVACFNSLYHCKKLSNYPTVVV